MESKPGDNNQDKQSNDPNKDQNPNSTEQEIPQPEETKESTKDVKL